MKQLEIAGDVMKEVVSTYTGAGVVGGAGGTGKATELKKSIATDAVSGRISEQQARELTAQVNQRLVGGLGNAGASRLHDVPEVRQAIARARDEGSPVTVSSGDSRVRIGIPTRPPVPAPEAPGAGAGAGRWPFRRPARPALTNRAQLPKLRVEIVTAIGAVGGAQQVGEKSRHILILDCDERTLSLPKPTTGHTEFFRCKRKSVRDA